MSKQIPESVRQHMAMLGAKGGAKSRRKLTKAEARRMVKAREAKRAKKPKQSAEDRRWQKAGAAARKNLVGMPRRRR